MDMIAQINRTRICEWKLKSDSTYNGYTWKLLSKELATENDNQKTEFYLYTFMFYDRNGKEYGIKRIGSYLISNSSINYLAREIIINYDKGF